MRHLALCAALAIAGDIAAATAPPAPTTVSAASVRSVTVPLIEGEVKIDGVLDEPAWQAAATLDNFYQFQPVDDRPAEEQTEVRVFYDAQALYFGVRAHDSQPTTVHATVADRDNLANDDTVTIYLDTFNDHRRAFYFTINPLGSQEDGVRTEGMTNPSEIDGGDIDKSPDFVFQSRGRLTPEGYEVELRIPFKSLRYPATVADQVWGLNVERRVRRTGYVDTWTDVRRGNTSFLAQSGLLRGLGRLQSGVVLDMQPFVTFANHGLLQRNFSFKRSRIDPDVGANLHVGLSPDISIDLAVNPDFSQVESDIGLVTLNERFALFYPEKRPFFLENIDLFSAPNRLIYTRRVANPIFGAKLTLKRGAFGLAHLTAVDERLDSTGSDSLVTATRLRRDLGGDSTAGLTATYRDSGEMHNAVLAGDARWVFGKLYFVRAQGGASWTRQEAGKPTVFAPLWLGEVDRTGRRWGFNYKASGIGHGFDAQVGFVPRTDVVEASAANRISLYGRRGGLVESFSLYHALTRRWDYRGFVFERPLEDEQSLLGLLQLRRGWQVATQLMRSAVGLDSRDYEAYGVLGPAGVEPFIPPDVIRNTWYFHGSVALPTFRKISGSLQVRFGTLPLFEEGSRGQELRWDASVKLRPTPSLRLEASLAIQRLHRTRDNSEFARTLLPHAGLEYQPKRALFLRVVAEYRSERTSGLRHPLTGEPLLLGGRVLGPGTRRQLRLDALIAFEPTPGTVAFAGYGSSHTANPAQRLPDLTRVSDGFFVKLAYRFGR